MRAIVALSLVFLSSLASAEVDFQTKILKGFWGGENVRLWATPDGADGNFDCSSGRITQPIIVDDFGHFCVTGYMNFYDGNGAPTELPATFIGDISKGDDDDTMTLRVNMPGMTWIYHLTEKSMGTVKKCNF